MVDGGGLGMRLGALCLISCPADAPLTAVSACLSLLPAGPGAPQLCAPAVFLQGLLQTVLEPSLLQVLGPCLPL